MLVLTFHPQYSSLHFTHLTVNIAASPGSVKQKASSSNEVVPEVKVVHRQIINESHPVVQQLVEEYEYDLDASIEAVQLFGTQQGAMDYLAGKEGDSGDEGMIAPSATILEPAAEERCILIIKLAFVDHLCMLNDSSGTIVVFYDPEAEKKYLTLDQLGVVLKHLSEQLPGISVHYAGFKNVHVSHVLLHSISDC